MNKNYHLLVWPLLVLLATALFVSGCGEKPAEQPEPKYKYESVEGDPLDARIYTLDNGLKVYLSVNKEKPRVQTFVAVRAGSKSDPKETTGLAHYLEHMVFKGTHDIGTTNWEAESVLLDSISALYELHRQTEDPAEKKAIYAQIDSLSFAASKYAVPNEYDKMISSLGANGTNAYTWVEQTVYTNNIPANELEKWLTVESERFQTLVLRLFHTELETVYEEYNRAYDQDSRKSWKALYEGLFPTHPYGTQTTIGEGEHLKNPSMVNIHNYFNKYYVPNNVAIALAGDLDPDKTIELIDKYFGSWERKELEPWNHELMEPISEVKETEVFGIQPEHVYAGFRLAGAGSKDHMYAELLNGVLSNGQAGLIDLNVTQEQKVLRASSYPVIMDDYSAYIFYGQPKEGQTLEEVKDILLEQLDSVKAGNFDDWLIDAVIKNKKLNEIRGYESNRVRADKFVDAFIWDMDYAELVNWYDNMAKITKDELVAWTNKKFGQNYVAVYKRSGKKEQMAKVEKPNITPLEINRDTSSAFMRKFKDLESDRLEPMFIDYEQEISNSQVTDQVPFAYIKNENNELFSLYYIVDMGTDTDKELGLAVDYLPYLGTDKYTPAQLQQEFFKLGVDFSVFNSRDKVYVTLSGLSESFEEGIKLFEHLLENAQPNAEAKEELVKRILKGRNDAKKDKGAILYQAMVSYGTYGPVSPQTDILSKAELQAISPESLVEKIHKLTDYKHRVFYYGPKEQSEALATVKKLHEVNDQLLDYPEKKDYPQLDMTENVVYWVDYDMTQAEILMMSKGPNFDAKLVPYAYLFNEYFGAGLSSIVFQEIRESKALAYSAYSYISTPSKTDEAHYIRAYIGTQADKLSDATDALLELMNNMPEAEDQFNSSRDAALKSIESQRTVGSSIFWSYERAKDRGLDHDLNKDIYEALPNQQVGDLKKFFDENIKDRNYTFLVLGNKEDLDMDALKKLGKVHKLELEEIFNY